MKKTLLFVRLIAIGLIMLFSSGWAVGQVFMTEIADPNNDADARFIELFNAGASDVVFTDGAGWKINKYTNGSATVSLSLTLTGTIVAGDYYLIAYDLDPGIFLSTYGFAADQLDAVSNGVVGGNGDDTIELVDGTGTTVDFYGAQPIVDLSGTVWEYEDGRAERATGATTGKNPPADADWNTWSDGSGGDIILTHSAPDDYDPGVWIGDASSSLTITSPNGGEALFAGKTYDIEWTSSNYVGTVDIEYYDGTDYTTIADDETDDGTYPFTIPSDITPGTTFKIRISDDMTSITTSDESDADFTVLASVFLTGTMNGWGGDALTYQEDLGTASWKYTYQENSVTATEFVFRPTTANWDNKWARGDVVSMASLTTWWNNGGNGTYTSTVGKFYTYIFKDVANGENGEGYVFETTATPVTLDAVSHLPTIVTPSNPVVVTITASATPSAEENIYVRYSTDDFTTSSYVQASFTGTTGTATIPAQVDGTTVTYYVLSTGLDLTTPPTDVDLATINYNTNSGANYSYYSETPGVEPIVGDLMITEVSGDGVNSTSDDGFIEIFNTSSNRISLDNVSARYYNSNPGASTQTVVLSGNLDAGEFIIVTQNGTNFLSEYAIAADFTGSLFYFNGGDDGVDIYHSTLGILDQFNDNGVGANPWTWEDNSVWERTSDGSGAVITNWTEYPDETGTPKSLLSLYWTGTNSYHWVLANNWLWDIVPTSSYNVTIPVVITNYPLVVAGTTGYCNNLEVAAGAALSNNNGGTLLASGVVTVQSDASTSGSILGTVYNASHVATTITYNRYVTGGQWHLMGAPFEGQDIGDLIDEAGNAISSMKDYNTGTDDWNANFTSATAGTMTSGEGYAIKRATDGIISISGTFPSDPIVSLTEGWNLLGNPYASAVYATTPDGPVPYLLNTSNVGSMATGYEALYVWEEDLGDPTNTNNYKTVNNATSGNLYKNNPQVTHLQAGQGFFVKASATATTFDFTSGMQDHQSVLSLYKEEPALWPTVSLQAEIANAKANTTITYNNMMTKGMDKTYDAGLLNSYPDFALYSRLVEDYEGIDFMLQALPEDYDNLVVSIGLDAKAGEIVTFSAQRVNIPEDYAVVLEDRAMNIFTDLSDEGEYAVQLDNASEGTGRFFVRTSMKSALGIGDIEKGAFQVFTRVNDNQLVMRGDFTTNTIARIYSITGKQIANFNLDQATEQSVSFNEESGVYIVQISNEQGTYTQKFSWVK